MTRALRLLPLLVLLLPAPSWALQSHAAPEGIYVHQMAHVLFICALGYLCWDIRRNRFESKGWQDLQIFCVLMIVWSCMALCGHWASQCIQEDDILSQEGFWSACLAPPLGLAKVFWYIFKLDHLILVPALWYFHRSLRTFHREAEQEDRA